MKGSDVSFNLVTPAAAACEALHRGKIFLDRPQRADRVHDRISALIGFTDAKNLRGTRGNGPLCVVRRR